MRVACSLSGMSSGPHGQTSDPAHVFSSGTMSNEVRYKSCSLHKSVTSPSNVTIVYVLVRIREVQSIQFCVMCLVLKFFSVLRWRQLVHVPFDVSVGGSH